MTDIKTEEDFTLNDVLTAHFRELPSLSVDYALSDTLTAHYRVERHGIQPSHKGDMPQVRIVITLPIRTTATDNSADTELHEDLQFGKRMALLGEYMHRQWGEAAGEYRSREYTITKETYKEGFEHALQLVQNDLKWIRDTLEHRAKVLAGA